jgi:YVTN family beta-propeller protein
VSSAAERPTGTVTFLFTDIEGSTRLLRELRDDYATALADHQRIIRAAIADHDGSEIDTQGDSFFAAFRRAKDAVGAAVDAQRALAAHAWPQDKRLRVRMGIHTGEPTVGGERYVGLGVHRAARIAAAGHGGQVLVSATTRELLRDDPPPDVSLQDLGEHQLKDLDEPERIYQLAAPGLDADFPPLKTGAPALAAGREGDLVEAAQETVVEMARPWRQRRRLFFGAGGAAALALVAVIVVVLTNGGGNAVASGKVAPNDVGLIDAKSGKISAQISVGHAPGGVAAGPDAVWVTNADENSVSRIDPRTNDVRQTIAVGNNPTGVAIGGGAVWVANGLDGTLSRIDPGTNRVLQTIVVGNGPTGVAYGAGAVWVANSADGTVSRVDPAKGRAVKTIPAANGVSEIAFGFRRLWVVASASGSVLALDPKTGDVLDRIGVGVDPGGVATGAGAVWVVNRSDGTLGRIDPSAGDVTDTINVGRSPEAVAVGADAVWVSNSASGTLSKIDPGRVRVVKTIRLTNSPRGLAVTPNGVYVAVRSTGLSHRGGTVRVGSNAPFDFIDPALAYSPMTWSILSNTNDGLVGFRRVGGIQGVELVPDLAVSLPVATDAGRTYTFRLRSGIRYSNGALVQPEDLRRAIERIFEVKPLSGGVQYFGGIVGAGRCGHGRCDLSRGIVTDPDARTVTFHLIAPDGDFLTKLALPFAMAVPASTPGHDVGRHPVPATGPYRIASVTKGGRVKLVRNPRFREWSADAQPAGYPDVILWRSEDDIHTGIRNVESGRADLALTLIPPLSKQEIDSLATRFPAQLRMNTGTATNYFFLNTRVAPFDDVRVRLAVNYAFDRQAFAALLGRAYAPTCQIFPPNFPSFRRTCPYLPGGVAGLDKARSLVRASGTTGQQVTVWLPAPIAFQGPFMVSVLKSLGFRARLHLVRDPRKYFDDATDSRLQVQAGYYGWASDSPSESSFIVPQFSCSSFVPAAPLRTTNASEFCNRSVDRLLRRAATVQALDPPAARVLWQRAERAILALAPMVPTYNKQNVDLLAKRVGNYQYHPQWGALVDQLWVR